jgi:hypothetical protein
VRRARPVGEISPSSRRSRGRIHRGSTKAATPDRSRQVPKRAAEHPRSIDRLRDGPSIMSGGPSSASDLQRSANASLRFGQNASIVFRPKRYAAAVPEAAVTAPGDGASAPPHACDSERSRISADARFVATGTPCTSHTLRSAWMSARAGGRRAIAEEDHPADVTGHDARADLQVATHRLGRVRRQIEPPASRVPV